MPQIALVRQGVRRNFRELPLRVGLVLLLALGAGIVASLAAPPRGARERPGALGGPGVLLTISSRRGNGRSWWRRGCRPPFRRRSGRGRETPSGRSRAGQGVPTVALQAPMEFPVEESPGARILAGFGVPDVRKSFGLWSVYTTDLLEEESTETGRHPVPAPFRRRSGARA